MLFRKFLMLSIWLFGSLQTALACEKTLIVQDDQVILCGEIDRAIFKNLEHLVRTQPVSTVIVTSGGGWVTYAIEIANLLNENDIKLIARSKCLSACAQYLIALVERVSVEPNTAIGLHQNPYGIFSLLERKGKIPASGSDRWRMSRIRAQFSLITYLKSGVNPRLLVDPLLAMRISCFHSFIGFDKEPSLSGYRVGGLYQYWLPDREYIEKARGRTIQGWWPDSLAEMQAAFLSEYGDQIPTNRLTFGSLSDEDRLESYNNFAANDCEQ